MIGRTRRGNRLLVIVAATLAVVGGSLATAGAAVAPATVEVFVHNSIGTFSPNGDGYDDGLGIGVILDGPASVTISIRDQAGATVRTLISDLALPGDVTYDAAAWDGNDDAGAPTPDGPYVVVAVATDGSGTPVTDTVATTVDRRVPGVVTAPTGSVEMPGVVTFELTPTPGIDVRSVGFVLASVTVGCSTPTVTAPDPDGVFRVIYDVRSCGEGPAELRASVTFLDGDGMSHDWASPSRWVFVRQPPAPPVLTVFVQGFEAFSPDGDGQNDEAVLRWCAADITWGQPLAIDVRVVDGAGATVRVLVHENRPPQAAFCGFPDRVTWDGLDDGSNPVPDGSYSFVVGATDPGGLSSVASARVVVDRRVPGTLVTPAAGATLTGIEQLAFAPTPGVAVSHVSFSLQRSTGTCVPTEIDAADPDGTFRGSFDTTRCVEGDASLALAVQYTDAAGDLRWWYRSVAVVVSNPGPPNVVVVREATSRQVFSPDGDGNDDVTGFLWCASDTIDGSQLLASVRVLDAGGSPVRTFVAGEVREPVLQCDDPNDYDEFADLIWDGLDDRSMPVPDGDYSFAVVVTDATGQTGVGSLPVTVDRRHPGTFTAPVAGTTLAGPTTFELVPTPGFDITEVDFQIFGATGTCAFGGPPAPDPDGAFRAVIDPTGCGDLPGTAEAIVWYIDSVGESRVWYAFVPVVTSTLPVVVPGSVWTVEGTGTGSVLRIPVTLSAPSAVPVTVQWRTLPVPGASFSQADAGDDYVAASGEVVFAPGSTVAVVEVTAVGDAIDESDELIVVSFTSAVNARVGGYWGLGGAMVVDDDEPGAARVGSAPVLATRPASDPG